MKAISFFGIALFLGFEIIVTSSVNEFCQNGNSKNGHSEIKTTPPEYFLERPSSKGGPPGNISYEKFEETLRQASLLQHDEMFQDLNPFHRDLARPLFQMLMRISIESLDLAFQIARENVSNKHLCSHLERSVTANRNDTTDRVISSHVTLAPHSYFDLSLLSFKKQQENKTLYLSGQLYDDPESRDLEYRLSHFRLDPGVNTHHERWHIAHLDSPGYQGDWSVDRSGEMFYYMHSQMIHRNLYPPFFIRPKHRFLRTLIDPLKQSGERYNFERLCAQAPFVEPLLNLRNPIPEPYFENLKTENRESFWNSRPPHQYMTDIDVRGFAINVQDLEVWRSRIYEAIDRGHVYRLQGDVEVTEPLNGPKEAGEPTPGIPFDVGIDKLGNMVWANQKSVNFRYYGNLHNQGHVVLGNMHDPLGVYHRQSRGMAMSATSTAARDPLFYRWHKFIDEVFERYKATLPQYTEKELEFENISISGVQIKSCGTSATIRTRWVRDRVNITEGISSKLKDEILQVKTVYYDFVHLAQDDFEYHIDITSKHKKPLKGTVRIFMAPIYKDWKYVEQLAMMDMKRADRMQKINKNSEPDFNKYRRLFIELDKFVVDISAYPKTTSIVRNSRESSVTVPFENLFMTSDEAKKLTNDSKEGNEFLAWNGCGWPNYLLVGRGNETGFPVQLFVMVSDFEKDKVPDDVTKDPSNSRKVPDKPHKPHGSLSHCGVPYKKHPDRKPMGFPFDRNINSMSGTTSLYLHHFMSRRRQPNDAPDDIKPEEKYENMKVIDIKIQHCRGDPVNGSTIDPEYNACKLQT